jgi:acetate kinase
MKNLLVINAGSSSIKFSLFKKGKNLTSIFSGSCDEIDTENSSLIFKDREANIHKIKIKISNHKEAINLIIDLLKKQKLDFDAIAHRIVQGGHLHKVTLIDKKVENTISSFSSFASLHNPFELKVIQILKNLKKPQYAVFDTEFFVNLPEVSKIYPIPLEISKKYNLRRYGFHGISHEYVSENLKGKTIVCHLGSGCSVSAIKDGKALDTSMGMTPLEGVMMRTRSGSIDPGIILFLQKRGYNLDKILMEDSGFKGISGKEDFRDILKTIKTDKNSKLAYDMFVYSISKMIGSYIAVLNGLDNLIFTAAIGENVPMLRKDICDNLKFLGLEIDHKKNEANNEIISAKKSKVKIYVKKTNEEYLIAKKIFLKW